MATPVSEPARILHLVDGNGEASPVCEDCLTKDAEKTRAARSYQGEINRLKDELRKLRNADDQHGELVAGVLDEWASLGVASKFWTVRPTWESDGPRARATLAALNKGRGYWDLWCAMRGAFAAADRQRAAGQRFDRVWLEPKTIFGSQYETHRDYWSNPQATWSKRLLFEVPQPLRERWVEVVELGAMCDCGELRFDHHYDAENDTWPCSVHGSTCIDFSDEDAKWLEWRQGKIAELKRRPVRCRNEWCENLVTVESYVAGGAGFMGGFVCEPCWQGRGAA